MQPCGYCSQANSTNCHKAQEPVLVLLMAPKLLPGEVEAYYITHSVFSAINFE